MRNCELDLRFLTCGWLMNKQRRDALAHASQLLSNAIIIVENACEKEQEVMENYPENLQGTENFELIENAVEYLSDATEKINEAKELIDAAIK